MLPRRGTYLPPLAVTSVSAFRDCEQNAFNAETAETAEKKCLKMSPACSASSAFKRRVFTRRFRRTVQALYSRGNWSLPHMVRRIALQLLFALVAVFARAEDWPQFRGPSGQGHSTERGVPFEWSETRNVLWKTRVPGSGWSSPVVAGGRVW